MSSAKPPAKKKAPAKKRTKKIKAAPPQPDGSYYTASHVLMGDQAPAKQETFGSLRHKGFSPEEFTRGTKVRLYRNLAIGFFIVALILASAVFLITFKKVEVKVLARPRSVSVDALFEINKENAGKNAIKAVFEIAEKNFKKEYKPETVKEEPGKAEGMVVIKNETERNQPLVSTTRLLSEAGVLFRLKKSVVVPAKGKIEVDVYADQMGASGNIGPSKFSIPGLYEALQKYIHAQSSLPMEGGVRKVGVLGQADIDKAKDNFIESFLNSEKAAAQEKYKEHSGIAVDFQGLKIDVNEKIGNEIDSFVLSGKAKVIIAAYDVRLATEWIDLKAKEKTGSADIALAAPDSPPNITIDQADERNGSVRLLVERKIEIRINKNSALLSPALLTGKSAAEIQALIGQMSGVDGVTVKFFPSWADTAPNSPGKIRVTVEES